MQHVDLPQPVTCEEHLWITMDDGVRLAARLWLPAEAEDHPVPAILEYIPYRKRDLTRGRDQLNHPYLAARGYACLRVDLRGSGDSEGVLCDQYLERELADGEAVIAWLAQQDWCNGRIGMFGLSWGGFNALQIAARRPPGLGAIVTACSTDDLYRDNMHYMGGCLLSDNLSEATTMLAFNSLPPDPALVGDAWRDMWHERLAGSGLWLDTWLRHQRRDAYWRRASVCEDYSAIQCPVLAVSGWADGFTNAVFRLLQHLDVPRRGLIGPWSHRYPHQGVPGPAIGFLQEVARWFDRWLKDIDYETSAEPTLRVWMQDSVPPHTSYEDRPGRWVAESEWPSPRIQPQVWRLHEHHRLRAADEAGPSDGEEILRSPLSVGLYAGKWCSYAGPPDLPGDQRLEDGGSLIFESAVLEEPIEILGTPRCELEVSGNAPTGMIAARLNEVRADGSITRLTYGLLNLAHRYGDAEPRAMPRGSREMVTVLLNGIAQRIPAGHRLRLALSTSYWPLAWPAPHSEGLRLHLGGCQISLPLRPADESQPLRPFEAPEAAEPEAMETIQANRPNWTVENDLANDTSTLVVRRNDDEWRLPAIDLTLRRRTLERYSARAEDPLSARGSTETLRRFSRGDWQITVTTRTVLTCDAEHFYLHAQLDAYEGERRVSAETWNECIPRDLL